MQRLRKKSYYYLRLSEMKEDFRLRFIWWLAKIFRIKEGCVLPVWLRAIRSTFYPLRYLYERNTRLHYDILRDSYTIEGNKFNRSFFKSFYIKKEEERIIKISKNEYDLIISEIVDHNSH